MKISEKTKSAPKRALYSVDTGTVVEFEGDSDYYIVIDPTRNKSRVVSLANGDIREHSHNILVYTYPDAEVILGSRT